MEVKSNPKLEVTENWQSAQAQRGFGNLPTLGALQFYMIMC